MIREGLYDTSWGKAILAGLQRLPHMYEGTVPPAEVAKRRAKNKQARKSRTANKR